MARMKFLCDADRCIDCNACVTACKNENEVLGASIAVASSPSTTASPASARVDGLHALHGCSLCSGLPGDLYLSNRRRIVLHSKDLVIGCGYCFYACPFGAPQYPKVGNFGSRGKMDK